MNSRQKCCCEGRWRRSTWAESETRNNCHRYIWYIDQLFVLPWGTVKRAAKNVQLVLWLFCKTSWLAMSRVLPTTKNKPCNLICRKTGLNDTCVVKPATLLFNSFCCNVAKQFARFLLPVLLLTLFLIVRHKVATARAELHQTVSTVYIILGIGRTYLWRQGDQLRKKGWTASLRFVENHSQVSFSMDLHLSRLLRLILINMKIPAFHVINIQNSWNCDLCFAGLISY